VKRFPLYVFGGLVVATVAAFFVTQHLKVTTPLVGGLPTPAPGWISPIDGGVCKGVGHRSTHMSFYLYRADDVNVYVVDDDGTIVQTIASGRHMARKVRTDFVWNGREADGTVAPDGTYHFRVALINEGRAVIVGGPIHIRTTPPRPAITSVSPNLIPDGSTPVTIRFRGNEDFRSQVQIYRTDVPGTPRLVDSFETKRHPKQATWDGTIAGVPAPAGTYLLGLQTTDLACNTGRFPIVLPPVAGSTPHAGVTVRYLAAQPSLDPVKAGTLGIVDVDSRTRPYAWTLSQYGSRKPLTRGRVRRPGTPTLTVKLPPKRPGLYVLALSSGQYRTAVPLVASAPRSARHQRILVVLPALTWQGENPVDDDGDGLVNTLAAGDPIRLDRPFAAGLPAGLGDEAALLAYLDKAHLGYDLTTDVALISGVGPPLTAYQGVVFAGTERWLPPSFAGSLQSYVQHGGHVLSLGIDSLRGRVTIQNTSLGPEALAPTPPSAADALGARPASALVHTTALITVITDGLGIFSGTSLAFPNFGSYEPIVPPSQPASDAGPTTASLSIVGYHLGSGIVVEVGLVGFSSSLRRDVDAQEFVNRLWQVLGR
jgi:hypothetical protein